MSDEPKHEHGLLLDTAKAMDSTPESKPVQNVSRLLDASKAVVDTLWFARLNAALRDELLAAIAEHETVKGGAS